MLNSLGPSSGGFWNPTSQNATSQNRFGMMNRGGGMGGGMMNRNRMMGGMQRPTFGVPRYSQSSQMQQPNIGPSPNLLQSALQMGMRGPSNMMGSGGFRLPMMPNPVEGPMIGPSPNLFTGYGGGMESSQPFMNRMTDRMNSLEYPSGSFQNRPSGPAPDLSFLNNPNIRF